MSKFDIEVEVDLGISFPLQDQFCLTKYQTTGFCICIEHRILTWALLVGYNTNATYAIMK